MAGQPLKNRPLCTAHRKDGQPCQAKAATGSNVCTHHGANGNTQRPNLAATIELARRTGIIINDDDPTEGLAAAQRQLRWHAQHANENLWQLINNNTPLRYQDDQGGEQQRSEVTRAQKATWDLHQASALAIKLGLDERASQRADLWTELLLAGIDQFINHLQLTPTQQQLAIEGVPKYLLRQNEDAQRDR
jgi:hypothetical protein